MFIDNSIDLNISELPQVIQQLIRDCEKYDNIEGEIMYMGISEGLEVVAKQMYANKVISKKQLHKIWKKYCGLE